MICKYMNMHIRVFPQSPALHIIFYKNLKTKFTITLTTMTVLPCFRPTLTAAAVQIKGKDLTEKQINKNNDCIKARQVQTKCVGQSIRSKKILTKK